MSTPSLLSLKRILVPTDLSAPSARALAYAAAFARQFDAELVLLHVYEPLIPSPAHTTAVDLYKLSESIHSTVRVEIEQFAKPYLGEGENKVNARLLIRDGLAVDEIVGTAKEEKADLLVISTHGRTGLKHILMGSIAEKVVRHAPCPVLVVRENERDFVPTVDPALGAAIL